MRGQSVVRGNTSGTDGGGIYNAEGTITMLGGSSVRRNTADGGDGGGIFNDSGTLVGAVAGSSVVNNVPDDIAP
jgi:predicted outer membrane repeat protein